MPKREIETIEVRQIVSISLFLFYCSVTGRRCDYSPIIKRCALKNPH